MTPESRNEFRKYLDPAIVSRLSSLELKSKYIVEGFMLGLHRSPYHGFSIEFSQHRPYMQGDAVKDIDWKAYGKTDRYFVKQYEEETNLKCHILLDCSASMAFGYEGRLKKFEYGAMLASALSYLSIHQKDAAGLTLYAEEILQTLPPRASTMYLNEIIKTIASARMGGKTNSGRCLSQVAEKINRRGLVVIISDFFDDIESTLSALKHFRFKKNEVIVFQILDPMELSFAFGRDATFVDMESGEEMLTQPWHIQKSYKDAMSEFTGKLRDNCLNSGIEYNVVDTNTPFDKALFSYLQKRGKLF